MMNVFFRRWTWLLLLIALSFSAFYATSIDNGTFHDKLKYLSISWSMYTKGGYLIPLVNGVPYTDKPPLLFWLIVALWHLFGVNMFGPLLLVNGFVASWGLLLRAIYATIFPKDGAGKDLIPYLLIGSYAIWRDVWFLRVDLILVTGVLFCNLGIFMIFSQIKNVEKFSSSSDIIVASNNQKLFRSLLFIALGCCLGLYSKGPVVYVFTLLPLLISAIFTPSYRQYCLKIILAMLMGTLFFLATWAIPAILNANHDFAQNILYKQIAHRVNDHRLPMFIYFYRYVPWLLMPWAINALFIKKICLTFKQASRYSPFIITMFIVSLVIFTGFGEKSLWYILPIIPFMLIFFTRFLIENQQQVYVVRLNLSVLYIYFGLSAVICCILFLFPALDCGIFKTFGDYLHYSVPMRMLVALLSTLTILYIVCFRHHLVKVLMFTSIMMLLIYGYSKIEMNLSKRDATQIDQMSTYLREQHVKKEALVLYEPDAPEQINYYGQFTYSTRMAEVIPRLKELNDLKRWLLQHPQGMVLYLGKECPGVDGLHVIVSYQERKNFMAYQLCQM